MVELLIVVVVLGIVVRLALPAYHDIVLRARAASALSDLQAVRLAAYSYYADTNDWPADRYPGQVPPELEGYLSEGFSFQRDGYRLDWENWVLPDGTPRHPGTGVLLGVSVTTDDADLGRALVSLTGDQAVHYTLGRNYTFVIASN